MYFNIFQVECHEVFHSRLTSEKLIKLRIKNTKRRHQCIIMLANLSYSTYLDRKSLSAFISYSTLTSSFFNSVFVLDKGKPGWSSWSDFGPCSSNCKKTRQRFCASSNKDKDCPGHSFGVESQEVVCPSQECKG